MDKEAAKQLGQQLIAAGQKLIDENSDEITQFEKDYDLPNFYQHWTWLARKCGNDESWWVEGHANDTKGRTLRGELVVAAGEPNSPYQIFQKAMRRLFKADVLLATEYALILRMDEVDAIAFAKLPGMNITNTKEIEQIQPALDVLVREGVCEKPEFVTDTDEQANRSNRYTFEVDGEECFYWPEDEWQVRIHAPTILRIAGKSARDYHLYLHTKPGFWRVLDHSSVLLEDLDGAKFTTYIRRPDQFKK